MSKPKQVAGVLSGRSLPRSFGSDINTQGSCLSDPLVDRPVKTAKCPGSVGIQTVHSAWRASAEHAFTALVDKPGQKPYGQRSTEVRCSPLSRRRALTMKSCRNAENRIVKRNACSERGERVKTQRLQNGSTHRPRRLRTYGTSSRSMMSSLPRARRNCGC